MNTRFFVSCPKGVEVLLQDELAAFGLEEFRQTVGGVHCEGDFALAYRVCLWSRLANRMVWVLDEGRVTSRDELYELARNIPWQGCFSTRNSFAVHFRGTNQAINHSNYGALVIKDAIADQFTEEFGERPNVDAENPEVQVYAHLHRDKILIGIELSGGSLHQRGYRLQGSKAPLKENLAAALLIRAGYRTGDERLLVDPLCGSGTLLVEGVLLRLGIAPNVDRNHFGFEHLLRHQQGVWQGLLESAKQQRQQALETARSGPLPLAVGSDMDGRSVEASRQNLRRAGLTGLVLVREKALADFTLEAGEEGVLLVTNPPYGERLEEHKALYPLYKQLGEKILKYCKGSSAAVLCSDDYLLKALSLQKKKSYRFFNGAIPAELALFDIYRKEPTTEQPTAEEGDAFRNAVEMVANRLRKNRKKLEKWAKKEGVEAYRLYDADMPEYSFALDIYGNDYQLTEYAAPKSVDKYGAFLRRQQFETAVRELFALQPAQLHSKERRKQKGSAQYEKMDQTGEFFEITEGPCLFWVNLDDYLDTGLFLDHRPVRQMIGKLASGKRFLNLFSYTATATVHAAKGGAASSVSVDMSNTYNDWALRNFRSNGLDTRKHTIERADCLEWVRRYRDKFDLIFLDPPSFSNSTRMEGTLDIQRDHVALLNDTLRLLANDGLLIFSTNRSGFKLDATIEEKYRVENITPKTIDVDFERNAKIHQCWEIRWK